MKQIFLLLLIIMIPACQRQYSGKKAPVATSGVLDLSAWDFGKEGLVKLNGDWEFYWQQLLTPEAFSKDTLPDKVGFFKFPGSWNGYLLSEAPLSSDGYATFRLNLKLKDAEPIYAIKVRSMVTAHQLWVNGRLISSAGKVGINHERMTPAFSTGVLAFHPEEKDLQLVLQISNFYHNKGGPWNIMYFGKEKQIYDQHKKEVIQDWFLFGSLMIMGLYHFGLYGLRRKNPSTLYFGIFSLLIGVHQLLVGEQQILFFFPALDWELYEKMAFLNIVVLLPILCLFIKSLYPHEFSTVGLWFFQASSALWGILTLMTPAKIHTYSSPYFQGIILIMGVYVIYVLVRAILNKREGSLLIILGFLVFFACVVNDILFDNEIIFTAHTLSFGLLAFIFAQSFILSMRFSKAFNTVEIQSETLIANAKELKDKNEALSKLDQMKDEFLANTSHELRTPLNGIIGLTESLLDGAQGAVSKAQAEDLNLIIQSGRRLSNLINDILDFSKMKNQELSIQMNSVDIRSMVEMILKLSLPLVQQKPVKLVNTIKETIPPVLADENRLQQILYNLIGNGIKFTHEGEVTVSAIHEGDSVTISIRDTGIGIPNDKIGLIFNAFEQLEGDASRSYGGTGLGLAVTKKLVELHGGCVEVASFVGKGSTFSFSLPACLDDQGSFEENASPSSSSSSLLEPLDADIAPEKFILSQEEKVHSEQEQKTLRSQPSASNEPRPSSLASAAKCILIVDDEPVNLKVLTNQLKLENYRVLVAQDGIQALELLEKEKPDLILLDVMMPRMNGYEVCQKIRESHSAAILPIVMLTAKNQTADLVQGFEIGANDYLTKPFQKRELLARVESQLKLKEAAGMMKEAGRLELELKTARVVQTYLIPDETPKLKELEIASFYQPASETGGDWYNYRHHPEHNTLDVLIGDVTGHGVQAAIVTAIADSVFMAIEEQRLNDINMEKDTFHLRHPSYFLKQLNDVLRKTASKKLTMTCFYSVIDLERKKMLSISAGHNPCYIWRPSAFHSVKAGHSDKNILTINTRSNPLGYGEGQFHQFHIQELQKDDVILWYTDGLTENYNEEGKEFGTRALKQILKQSELKSAEEIKNNIIDAAFKFYGVTPQEDDITLLVAKIL
ncbi:SpoIIE family protein phosphatase [Deltaproteobacteria bacterium TL4]